MSELDEFGREVFDQTPVAIPFNFDRPEPIHMRLRRMVEAYHQQANPEYETLDDANDFEIEDDPSSYDSTWTEPDLEPVQSVQPAPAEPALTEAEIAAAREAVMKLRSRSAGSGAGVSSPEPAPAEPAEATTVG